MADNNEQHSFSSVLSINPYRLSAVNAVSSFLSSAPSLVYDKSQYVISYLNSKSFIANTVSISKNIPQEDLYDAIYNKIYDEFGLDYAIEYQIQYIETFVRIEENNRLFHVFVMDPLVAHEVFTPVVEQVKYIDYIIPSPLLYKALYSKAIIDDNRAHCFIYFQENDTFITVYSNQEFLYTKSISYSFKQMHDRFCEIYGQLVDYDEFLFFIEHENLKTTASDYKPSILKLYKEIFANINDIFTYIKRALDIDKIAAVYIDSQIKMATALDELCEFELSVKSSRFNFDYGFEHEDAYIDHMHYLMHLYTTISQDERYECNFTSFPRPAKFSQRASGRAIIVFAASTVLAFLYPVAYWTLTTVQEYRLSGLESEYRDLHAIKTTREAIINNKEDEKKKIMLLVENEEKEYGEKKANLIKIHDVKVNYPMKAEMIYNLMNKLNSFGVKLESLSYQEVEAKPKTDTTPEVKALKQMKINLVSQDDKKITALIEHLTKIYEGRYHFSIDAITYNSETKLYFGELRADLL